MPSPTTQDVHVDVLLTQISVAWIQAQTNYVADSAFPIVAVDKQSNRYLTYNKGDWFRSEVQARGISAESVGGGWDIDNTPTYYAMVYAIHKDIDDQIRANADMDIDRDATEWVTQQLLLKKDIQWAQNFFVPAVWTGALAGVAAAPTAGQFIQWDLANSHPINDIMGAVITMSELTGLRPNKLVLGPHAYNVVRNHVDVLDRIKYTQRGFVTTDLLAALFDVGEVLVPFVVQNTAQKGAADTMQFLYGRSALLLYTVDAPSLLKATAGYTFAWDGYAGAGAFGNRISRFRADLLRSDRVEGEMAYDMRVIAPDCGTFFATCVSATAV
jgi:hypothetical protein